MMKQTMIRAGFAALAGFGLVAVAPLAQAQEPTPNTFADVSVPLLAAWVGVNAQVVDGDDRDGRTYIYPDEATRDQDTMGSGAGSVAFITWDLDDGSGRAPGIQVVSDDFDFPTQGCIMASGERESEEFPGSVVPKTCSDPEGSSKRLFLEVTQADAPVDLVFSTGTGIIRYRGVRDPSLDDGAALEEFREEFGIGRIYRVIFKFLNETDERLVGVEVQLGTGVGDAFTPLTFADDGVGFEMRTQVPRQFFVGNTGAGPRRVWNPLRFAHFSPKLFHDGIGERFDFGFFDVQRAGLFPPQTFEAGETSAFIYSGEDLNESTGITGAVTPNYFDMATYQAASSSFDGFAFGYLMPSTLVPYIIDRHDDGNPLTEGDQTMAWWDGDVWRYGVEQAFAEVPESQLRQWAALLLGLDNSNPEVGPERYGSALSDDLSGMNMDVFVRLDERILDEEGLPRFETLTLRLVAVSAEAAGIAADSPGMADPLWTQPGNEPVPLATYMPVTGEPVALNDFARTMRNASVDIDVLANDLLDGEPVPNEGQTTITIVDDPSHGTVSVNPVSLVVTYEPEAFFAGQDSFTYTITIDEEDEEPVTSNLATVSITVVAPPDPSVPVARNDSATTLETEPVTINVIANDTVDGSAVADADDVQVVIVDQPLIGSAVVNADNTITYTASAESVFPLIERFTYAVVVEAVQSNTALVTVRADQAEGPIVPVAADDNAATTTSSPVVINVLANDTFDGLAIPEDAVVTIAIAPVNGGAVVNANGTVTYTASEGFVGNDTFTYQVAVDDVLSNAATVTVAVAADDEEEPVETGGGDGCDGCSTGGVSGAPASLLLLLAGLLVLRRRQRREAPTLA